MGQNIFIGELSKRTGIPVKTIRYYEDLRILVSPKRTESEYRVYSDHDIEKLLFVKKAKDLGLTLAEIREILEKSGQGVRPCCDMVQTIFNRKIKEYEDKIADLAATKHRLEEKLQTWITPKQAKTLKYTICPHIETDGVKKKRKKGKA
jgi:MerR family transcriptional regulator, copper efflux regulator